MGFVCSWRKEMWRFAGLDSLQNSNAFQRKRKTSFWQQKTTANFREDAPFSDIPKIVFFRSRPGYSRSHFLFIKSSSGRMEPSGKQIFGPWPCMPEISTSQGWVENLNGSEGRGPNIAGL